MEQDYGQHSAVGSPLVVEQLHSCSSAPGPPSHPGAITAAAAVPAFINAHLHVSSSSRPQQEPCWLPLLLLLLLISLAATTAATVPTA
jgi:hypothetical protein